MFDSLKAFFELRIQDIMFWQVCLCFTLSIVAAVFTVYIMKKIWSFTKSTGRASKRLFKRIFKSYRRKCSEIQCPFCGKTLEHCTCTKNQDRTYRERYNAYRRWKKRRKIAQKMKNTEKKK